MGKHRPIEWRKFVDNNDVDPNTISK